MSANRNRERENQNIDDPINTGANKRKIPRHPKVKRTESVDSTISMTSSSSVSPVQLTVNIDDRASPFSSFHGGNPSDGSFIKSASTSSMTSFSSASTSQSPYPGSNLSTPNLTPSTPIPSFQRDASSFELNSHQASENLGSNYNPEALIASDSSGDAKDEKVLETIIFNFCAVHGHNKMVAMKVDRAHSKAKHVAGPFEKEAQFKYVTYLTPTKKEIEKDQIEEIEFLKTLYSRLEAYIIDAKQNAKGKKLQLNFILEFNYAFTGSDISHLPHFFDLLERLEVTSKDIGFIALTGNGAPGGNSSISFEDFINIYQDKGFELTLMNSAQAAQYVKDRFDSKLIAKEGVEEFIRAQDAQLAAQKKANSEEPQGRVRRKRTMTRGNSISSVVSPDAQSPTQSSSTSESASEPDSASSDKSKEISPTSIFTSSPPSEGSKPQAESPEPNKKEGSSSPDPKNKAKIKQGAFKSPQSSGRNSLFKLPGTPFEGPTQDNQGINLSGPSSSSSNS